MTTLIESNRQPSVCAVVKSEFKFFQEEMEVFGGNPVVISEHLLGLIPVVLNSLNKVVMINKELGMIDPVVFNF